MPRNAPNLVCTTFVANALVDAYEAGTGSECLELSISAAKYIANELYWTDGESISSFCYPTPSSQTRVHNANLLGAALLCRIHQYHKDDKLLETALKVCQYSLSKQEDNGSWFYGEHNKQKWIDNFHTGYNLCALADINQFTRLPDLGHRIRKGFEFYRENFFERNGMVKYFHNKLYPIDTHCVAQSMITLTRFKKYLSHDYRNLMFSVFNWSVNHLLSDRGYFFYQKTACLKNKIPYIRWTQAWMLLALATFLEDLKCNSNI